MMEDDPDKKKNEDEDDLSLEDELDSIFGAEDSEEDDIQQDDIDPDDLGQELAILEGDLPEEDDEDDDEDQPLSAPSKLSNKSRRAARKSRQLRYLAQSVRLEEAVAPRVVRLTIVIIGLFLVAFIFWASVTEIEEIKRVQGEVEPLGFAQKVDTPEGGVVKDILAREGDTVEEGQLLVRLDSVDTLKDLERTRLKVLSLEMQRIRFQAYVDDVAPDYSDFIEDNPRKAKEQMQIYHASVEAEDRERAVLMDQIAQRQNAIDILRTRLQTTKNNLQIIQKLYDTRKKLKEEGVISEVRFLETQQRLNDLEGEVENLGNQIVAAEFALKEAEGRLSSFNAKDLDEDLEELETVQEELTQTMEVLSKLEARSQRLNIDSPVRGIVKGLQVNTIGSVVQPSQVLMEIIPLDRELIGIVRIQPDSIGYIRTGQRVKIKVSTYDFSRYGIVRGDIIHISAAPLEGPDGEKFFEGRIKFDQNYVGDNPDNQITPGMTIIADVIIGRKTIMQYLLKPIHQSLQTALTER